MSIYGEGRYRCPNHGLVAPQVRSDEQLDARQWELRCEICGEELEALPTDEAKPIWPMSVYAVGKRDHEELFLAVGRAHRLPTVAMRFFNVYGDRQALSNPYTGVAAIFGGRLLNGNAPLVFEDGLQSRDFIHVSDIAAGCITALETGGADYRAVNLGTGAKTTVLDVARELARGLGVDLEPQIVNKFRAGDIRHCYADITLARELLGFAPEDGVRRRDARAPVLGGDAAGDRHGRRAPPASSRPPASPGERPAGHHHLPGQHQQPGAAAGLPGARFRRRRATSRCRRSWSTTRRPTAAPTPSARRIRTWRWSPASIATGSVRTTTRRSSRATGRYVLILNEDTELHEGCLDVLCRFMDQNPRVGAAGPRILNPDGTDQPSAFHFPSPGRVALTTLTLQRAGWIQSGGAKPRRVDWVCGAAILARRAALNAIGGFDEQLFIYSEDPDLCLRLLDVGYLTAYVPMASLVHHENATTSGVPERRIYQMERSRALYARKHHGRAGELAVRGLTASAFGARAAIAKALLTVPGAIG